MGNKISDYEEDDDDKNHQKPCIPFFLIDHLACLMTKVSAAWCSIFLDAVHMR